MNRLNQSLLGLVAISATNTPATAAAAAVNGNSHISSAAAVHHPHHHQLLQRGSNGSTNGNFRAMTNNIQADSTAKNAAEAAQIVRNAQVVCFDVDSTVITEEGIDELAKYCGKGAEVARLTREAMKGSMTFQEALQLRLDIIRPSQRQIRDFLKAKPSTLSPGVKDFIIRLRAQNTKVYLITGGFDCLIEPVATELGIPMSNMYANRLYFSFGGEYAGFDTTQPTSHSGGKGEAIQLIRAQLADNANIVMIGDGATDLEASPPADHFIGYGGNIVRDEVRSRAKFYVTAFEQLAAGLAEA